MIDLVTLLRDRKITGLNSSNDPKSFAVEISETTDPLCIAAADEIERLRAELTKAQDEAYERAALLCEAEESGFCDRFDCADAIRLLKSKP